MSRSRRPSVSIYDYPEHLNPFSEEIANSQPQIYREGKTKDTKHKFWTFGRSRKKRSNSFSLKSTWNGLFGKRKDVPEVQEKRSTITTVSTAYKRESYVKPVASPRASKDQQEFDEALGTLARRRKYTLESSSRYSSSLTVNGDPARIYEGSPQDTTASIMGDLTPKPPARRFGQVSPKPTEKIPPLDFDDKDPRENGSVTLRDRAQERTPVPPLRRFGNRSSQRLNASTFDSEDEVNKSTDAALRDENENVPEDYVFKRFSQDAVRRSNLSINSCVSVGSTMSAYGRKKRRAPPPPRRKEQLETAEENVAQNSTEGGNDIELQINEPIDIAAVTENIHEMTKKSIELDDLPDHERSKSPKSSFEDTEDSNQTTKVPSDESTNPNPKTDAEQLEEGVHGKSVENPTESPAQTEAQNSTREEESVNRKGTNDKVNSEEATGTPKAEELSKKGEENVEIEYRRTSQDKLEIIKDVDQVNSTSELEDVCLRRKGSSGTLSRSDSFSVKEEIEKIERQIKALETKNASRDSQDGSNEDSPTAGTRQSIQANRRHFFQNMVEGEDEKSAIKIEFKELPREQKDIHVVRLTDPPVPVVAPRDPVKVIELHITEPIKHKPEILEDVNPIPKPRRHNSLSGSQTNVTSNEELSSDSERGKSF